jgi:outer membrane biosynthesis protein TonB
MRFRWVGKENSDEWGCRAYAVEREGNLELVGALVTIAMAKAEGWYTKNGSKWKTMPEQMLQYRAAAFWTRAYAPEIALGMHTAEEINDTPEANQVVKPVVMDVTPTPPEPKPRRAKKEPEAEAVVVEKPANQQEVVHVEPEPTPEPTPTAQEPVPAPAPAPAQAVPEATVPEKVNVETVEGTLFSIGLTYQQLVAMATELSWWPNPEAYPTAADLPEELANWVIRNRRGIARQAAKGGAK